MSAIHPYYINGDGDGGGIIVVMERLYTDVSKPESFTTPQKFRKATGRAGADEFVKRNEVYRRYRQVKHKHERSRTLTLGAG